MAESTSSVIGYSRLGTEVRSALPARLMSPSDRKDLGVKMLARSEPVTRLAATRGVSRKFAYAVAGKADAALDEAFSPPPDSEVLFHLPVTRSWIENAVVSLALLCHSPYRGIIEFLRDSVGHAVSIGTVHNIMQRAVARAREVNESVDLSAIRVGAHDEIYQAGRPVLVGADAESTYCYLLSQEDTCDETTWGVRLLELEERGLRPDSTVADGGSALRAGQNAAWPEVPCHGDVFHVEAELGKVVGYLENRAKGAVSARMALERKKERAHYEGKTFRYNKTLSLACEKEETMAGLASDMRTLAGWLRDDVLALAGPPLPERRELYDFIIAEIAARERLCPHHLGHARRSLEVARDTVLGFAGVLDEKLSDVARSLRVMPHLVRSMCVLQGLDHDTLPRYRIEWKLCDELGDRFDDVERAVQEAMSEVVRASSIVENLNSRLRSYFFLRREVGKGYLELLQCFINHHRFARSGRPERVGKSPRELLTGQTHPHWLEFLGVPLPAAA
jgi:hypothetical protein